MYYYCALINILIVVEVSPKEGVLPAYLQENIRLTLRPSLCEHYTCTVSYQSITNTSKFILIGTL